MLFGTLSLTLCLFVVYSTCQQEDCQTYTWTWPNDFQMRSSLDDATTSNLTCATIKPKNLMQNGKYFCWTTKDVEIPLNVVKFGDESKDLNCTPFVEVGDLVYTTRSLCMSRKLDEKLAFRWHSITVSNPSGTVMKCHGFKDYSMWFDNYLCAKPATVTRKVCKKCDVVIEDF